MEQHNQNWYAVITAKVLYSDTLTPRQKLLAAAIANMSNAKGYCFATNAHFAKMMNCSTSSIKRDLSALEEEGHIGRVVILKDNGEVNFRALTPIGGVGAVMKGGRFTDAPRGRGTGEPYNNKEENNKENSHLQLTDLQTEQLAMKYRLNVKQVEAYTEQVVAYYTGIGKTIHNLQSMVTSWIIKDQSQDKAKPAKADIPSPTYRKL